MVRQNVSNRQVNQEITNIKHLKNNYGLERYIKNIVQFTENLIIFYTIIHELSGIKQCEPRIENKSFNINYNSMI